MGLLTAHNAAGLTGAITAVFYAGCFFGCLLNSYIADKWGRKISLATGNLIVLIGSALTAGSVNIAMFIGQSWTLNYFVQY